MKKSKCARTHREYEKGGIREMLIVAFPMVVSHACETIMIFTDRLFLSRLGPEVMNAAMAGGLTVFMMTTFFIGLISYSTAVVAQYLGVEKKQDCSVTTSQAIIIAIAAYPLILLCAPLINLVFSHIGIVDEQIVAQRTYFNILIYATVISLLRHCLSSFFSGIGRTRIVMISSLVAMVVNVAVNYILIFGKCGAPALGIRGAAYGTIIGSCCGVILLFFRYISQSNRREFGTCSLFRFNPGVMRTLLRFGYPSGVEFFLNLFAFNMMVFIFHSVSLATATASTIVFNWDMVSFIPLIGVQVGVTSLVGRYMGAKQPDIAHKATVSGWKLGLLYSMVVFIFFLGFPHALVSLFRPTGAGTLFNEAFPMAVTMVRLASLYVLVEALMVTCVGALKGAGDTFWAMCFSIALHWVLVPVLFIMLKVLHFSPESGWLAIIVIFLLFSTLVFFRYREGKWKSIMVVEQEIVPFAVEGLHEG